MAEVTLQASCLFSKHGFLDGDILDDWIWDTFGTFRIEQLGEMFENKLLYTLVCEHLAQLIPIDVEFIDYIVSNHNPVRINIRPSDPRYEILKAKCKDISITLSSESIFSAARSLNDGVINLRIKKD